MGSPLLCRQMVDVPETKNLRTFCLNLEAMGHYNFDSLVCGSDRVYLKIIPKMTCGIWSVISILHFSFKYSYPILASDTYLDITISIQYSEDMKKLEKELNIYLTHIRIRVI